IGPESCDVHPRDQSGPLERLSSQRALPRTELQRIERIAGGRRVADVPERTGRERADEEPGQVPPRVAVLTVAPREPAAPRADQEQRRSEVGSAADRESGGEPDVEEAPVAARRQANPGPARSVAQNVAATLQVDVETSSATTSAHAVVGVAPCTRASPNREIAAMARRSAPAKLAVASAWKGRRNQVASSSAFIG